MAGPSLQTVKALFALSCNSCAYRGCEQKLSDPSWGSVLADICHIRGVRAGSARHDPALASDEVHDFANLILLCPNHHRVIDSLDIAGHPVDVLEEMKRTHEKQCSEGWTSDREVDRLARLALIRAGLNTSTEGEAPRMRLRVVNDVLTVSNVGNVDAFQPRVVPDDERTDNALVGLGDPPNRMSPGAEWRAARYVPTMGNSGSHSVTLTWTDRNGALFEGVYPL